MGLFERRSSQQFTIHVVTILLGTAIGLRTECQRTRTSGIPIRTLRTGQVRSDGKSRMAPFSCEGPSKAAVVSECDYDIIPPELSSQLGPDAGSFLVVWC